VNAIVATDRNWGIGKNNDLLVHLPGDLKYYKRKTLGKCVIFGQRTLESLPGSKPLPKRNHIVLSDDPNYSVEPREGFACDICHTKEEVLALAAEYEAAAANRGENPSDAVFICGGASIYELFFEDCDAFYVTRIDESFDADRFFPNLEEKGFVVTWESEVQTDEATGINYTFRKYERGV